MGKRTISDLRISLLHLVQRYAGHKTARGGDFQPIIIDGYLDMRILQITAILCEVVCYVKKVLVSPKTRAFFFL